MRPLVFDSAIFLAATGITTLEMVEAAAVGLALYGESGNRLAFFYVALGVVVVLVPTILIGSAISLLPFFYVKFIGGLLLLYFGIRLARSARRSVLKSRSGGFKAEEFEKGLMYTGFSVGAIEAFEAAIVLVGLIPNNFSSTIIGIITGVVIVIVSTFVLRNQVRKVKQANMKVVVSALLLSFSAFWFSEILISLNDLILVPLFFLFALFVYLFANRASPLKATMSRVSGETESKQ